MIKNYFFAGNVQPRIREYLIEQNQCKLLSYLTEKKDILDFIAKGFKGKLFVDSGAFSAHTRGVRN